MGAVEDGGAPGLFLPGHGAAHKGDEVVLGHVIVREGLVLRLVVVAWAPVLDHRDLSRRKPA